MDQSPNMLVQTKEIQPTAIGRSKDFGTPHPFALRNVAITAKRSSRYEDSQFARKWSCATRHATPTKQVIFIRILVVGSQGE